MCKRAAKEREIFACTAFKVRFDFPTRAPNDAILRAIVWKYFFAATIFTSSQTFVPASSCELLCGTSCSSQTLPLHDSHAPSCWLMRAIVWNHFFVAITCSPSRRVVCIQDRFGFLICSSRCRRLPSSSSKWPSGTCHGPV